MARVCAVHVEITVDPPVDLCWTVGIRMMRDHGDGYGRDGANVVIHGISRTGPPPPFFGLRRATRR